MLAGQIDMAFEPTQVLVGHIQDAKVRPLAITSSKRNPQLPDIPTMAESGVPGFASMSWTGLVAPAGTPEPILQRLSATINAELQSPEMKGHLARLGVESQPGTPADFQAFINAEVPKWAEVIKSSGMKLE